MANDDKRAAVWENGVAKLKIPVYSSINYVVQGEALQESISRLDNALATKPHNDFPGLNGDNPYYHLNLDTYNALTSLSGYTVNGNYPNRFVTEKWVEDHTLSNSTQHNNLLGLNGDNPYYHLNLDTYNALTNLSGYTVNGNYPNRFVTEKWVEDHMPSLAGLKSAYGTIAVDMELPAGTYTTTVDLETGIITEANGVPAGSSQYHGDTNFTNGRVIVSPRYIFVDEVDSTAWFLWDWILTGKRFKVDWDVKANMGAAWKGSLYWLAVQTSA